MTDRPLEPNKIADTYEALSDLHELISRIARAREEITGETNSILHTYASIIADRRETFGDATRVRNPFSMDDYRSAFGDTLPTIHTENLTDEERRVLRSIGIIDTDETFRLPCGPRSGRRMPLDPSGGLNVEYDMLHSLDFPDPVLTILHVSDTHLGYENRGSGRGNPNTKWIDRVDSVGAFRAIVQRAVADDVDLVVHTGDLFDDTVDRATLDDTVNALDTLTTNNIPFHYVLGSHDRNAIGRYRGSVNAVEALDRLTDGGDIVHATPAGRRAARSNLALFGVDATGVGPTDILADYTLKGWQIGQVSFDPPEPETTTVLCLHDATESGSPEDLVSTVRAQGLDPDLICCGDAHGPPFSGGNPWETTVEGVTISCAGPAIPVHPYFDDRRPTHTRITIDESGGISLAREPIR